MIRILEINYWKVIPGAEQDLEDPVWKFAKFAFKNLEAVFKFGFVQSGKYTDHVAFFFLWESEAGYEKWKGESTHNKEFQEWLAMVQDGGQKHKMVDTDIIHLFN